MKRLLVAANVAALLLIGINVNASHDPDGPPVVVERGWHLKKSRRFMRERLGAMLDDLEEIRDDQGEGGSAAVSSRRRSREWFKVYAALYWESDREELRKLTTGSGKVQ